MMIFEENLLHISAGAQVDPGGDRLVDIFSRAPLRATAAAQHAFGPTVKLIGALRLHEFKLRLPIVTQRSAGHGNAGGSPASEFIRKGGNLKFLQGLRDF